MATSPDVLPYVKHIVYYSVKTIQMAGMRLINIRLIRLTKSLMYSRRTLNKTPPLTYLKTDDPFRPNCSYVMEAPMCYRIKWIIRIKINQNVIPFDLNDEFISC